MREGGDTRRSWCVHPVTQRAASGGRSAGLAILDVEDFPLERYWHFVYPVGKQLSLVAQAFMEFARKEAGKLAASEL